MLMSAAADRPNRIAPRPSDQRSVLTNTETNLIVAVSRPASAAMSTMLNHVEDVYVDSELLRASHARQHCLYAEYERLAHAADDEDPGRAAKHSVTPGGICIRLVHRVDHCE